MASSTNYADLSHTLDATTQVYPGDPSFSCCPALTIAQDGVNVHLISLGSHTGTHVDAPYHFLESGLRIDEMPLSLFVGPALVVDVSDKAARGKIVWSDLDAYEERMREGAARGEKSILLLRTGWSRYWGTEAYLDHPFLDGEAAKRIIDTGIRTIGIDALSPDETCTDPGAHVPFDVHRTILGAGGVIIENLTNLEQVQEGEWVVNAVPLKIGGCDGSPVRAFAWRQMTAGQAFSTRRM